MKIHALFLSILFTFSLNAINNTSSETKLLETRIKDHLAMLQRNLIAAELLIERIQYNVNDPKKVLILTKNILFFLHNIPRDDLYYEYDQNFDEYIHYLQDEEKYQIMLDH